MVFSTISFLFFFFPLFLICYYLVPFGNKIKWKNMVLLVFSLIFYAWGEPIYIFLMIFTTFCDYLCSRKMSEETNEKKRRKYLYISLLVDLGLLGFFKYSDFFIESLNAFFHTNIPLLHIGLPIGISFYTFQTLSYTIDIYKKRVKVEKNYLTYLTYVSMFPQLIAGPIVRYETVSQELQERKITYSNFNEGFLRFLQGLFKKVLVANKIGLLWSTISTLPTSEISVFTAWLGLFAFAFQIYFDFSAYSDMAIGIGRMLGFHFLENFNYPYISKSITEFWRRWHISLSSWFRDYVYIPLGGSRVSLLKQIRNILVVWFLTGFWHGASWNFILWGLYFAFLLLLEKFVFKKQLEKLPNFMKHIYTIFFLLIGWLIFAFDDMTTLKSYCLVLFGMNGNPILDTSFLFYFKNYFLLFMISTIFSMPIYPYLKEKWKKKKINYRLIWFILIFIPYFLLFLITVSSLVADSYNPFLYFRF